MDFNDPTLWVAAGFILLVIGLFKPAKNALLRALDERTENIRQSIDEAASLREEAQQLLAEYQRKQRDALKETDNIIRHAEAEAKRLVREGEIELEKTLKRREQITLEKIAQAEVEAIREMRSLTVNIAVEATRSLIADRLDEVRSNELVDQAIENLSEKLQ